MNDGDKRETNDDPTIGNPARWDWSSGDLTVEDPETGEVTRVGEVPEKYRRDDGA